MLSFAALLVAVTDPRDADVLKQAQPVNYSYKANENFYSASSRTRL